MWSWLFCFILEICACCQTWRETHDAPEATKPRPDSVLPKAFSRPCLPDLLCLTPDWTSLPEKIVVSRVLQALSTWSAQVSVPAHALNELLPVVHDQLAIDRLSPTSSMDACICQSVLIACFACDDPVSAKDLSHQLGVLTRGMIDWAFPSDLKTKRFTSLDFDHLLHVVGSIRLLLHTRWQASAGRRRRAWARQRLQCVHPDLSLALSRPGSLAIADKRACLNLMAVQVRCKLEPLKGEGYLYLLCSLRYCYLGSTACDRRTWRCSMKAPMARFYEHLHDLRLTRRAASQAKFLRKTAVFRQVPLGDLCVWVVSVESLPMIRALEQCFLRIGHWPANSMSTKVPGHKQVRHSKASRRSGRRVPPRFRSVLDVHQHATSKVTFVLAQAANMVQRAARCAETLADGKYLAQCFQLNFHTAYWHVFLHRLALTGQAGPLDLRHVHCTSLFACYICDSKLACWESIRQRWALCHEPFGSEAIVAMFALLGQPACAARKRGIIACDRWIRRHGLPGTRKRTVQWPLALPKRVFKACLQDIRAQLLITCSPLVARWLVSCVQVVTPRRRTYAVQWNHIRTCRTMTDAHLFSLPPALLTPSSSEGAQMKLCKKYWKTPVWESGFCAARQAESNLRSWLRSLELPVDKHWRRHICGWLCNHVSCACPCLDQHLSYVADLTVPPQHVAAQEDKDKASCWIMPQTVYHKLFALMVTQDTDHWVQRQGHAADIAERYRQAQVEKLEVAIHVHQHEVQVFQKWFWSYLCETKPCLLPTCCQLGSTPLQTPV